MAEKKTDKVLLSTKELNDMQHRAFKEGRGSAKHDVVKILEHARTQPKLGIGYLLTKIRETV